MADEIKKEDLRLSKTIFDPSVDKPEEKVAVAREILYTRDDVGQGIRWTYGGLKVQNAVMKEYCYFKAAMFFCIYYDECRGNNEVFDNKLHGIKEEIIKLVNDKNVRSYGFAIQELDSRIEEYLSIKKKNDRNFQAENLQGMSEEDAEKYRIAHLLHVLDMLQDAFIDNIRSLGSEAEDWVDQLLEKLDKKLAFKVYMHVKSRLYVFREDPVEEQKKTMQAAAKGMNILWLVAGGSLILFILVLLLVKFI